MKFNKIRYSVENGIASIILNSPENLNAFNEPMIDDILCALELSKEDNAVKVVVISGEGGAFSGGGDIKEMYDALKDGRIVFETTVEKVGRISLNIKKMLKPVITSVSGPVAGAAFNIVLSSDFCIAAENSKFMQSFVKIGLVPDAGGIYLLTRAIGVGKATHLVFTGEPVEADEALELGIVYKKSKLEELGKETMNLASKLAAGPLKSYANMKKLIYESQFSDFENYISREVDSQLNCGHTQDFKEGITAFVEKRKPNFQGI